MTDPIQQLWAAQPIAPHPLDPAALARRAAQLRRQTWLRDGLEYTAGAVGIAIFAMYALRSDSRWMWAACALVIAGAVFTMVGLWRRRVRAAPGAIAATSADYLRTQLTGQRDSLASVWRWYLAPLVPGFAVFTVAIWLQVAERHSLLRASVGGVFTTALVAIMFYALHRINRAAARQLDDEITALDADTNQG
ncbi:MAG: hypothetical protein V4659_13470 [Pseudomonadota bacterium]